jgi:hypothetical protein
MGSGASRSSNLRGFLDPLDASDRVDVVTVLPRIEVPRRLTPPRCLTMIAARSLDASAASFGAKLAQWMRRDRAGRLRPDCRIRRRSKRAEDSRAGCC